VAYLTDQNGIMTTPDGKTETAQHKAGEVSWGPTKHREENLPRFAALPVTVLAWILHLLR
jgi:hypothetical protein